MDEGISAVDNPWSKEVIPDDSDVFRQSVPRDWIKDKKRRWPNEAAFMLRPNEDGLSVNWTKYMPLKENFVLIGLSQSTPSRYLNPTAFRIFKFPVQFLRSISGIDDVVHDPLFHGNPSPIGKPNNRAHSLVIYENDELIRMTLSDYCNENYADCYCPFEVASVEEELNALRERLNNTQFHNV